LYIYLYSSAYEEVHWDQKLVPRQHAPVTTFENGKPDPVVTTSAPPARPELWQTAAGKAWDRLQERKTYFTKQPVELYKFSLDIHGHY
jgi:hypothetical protein